LTVASANVERELTQFEDAHVCDPVRLHRLGDDAYQRLRPNSMTV